MKYQSHPNSEPQPEIEPLWQSALNKNPSPAPLSDDGIQEAVVSQARDDPKPDQPDCYMNSLQILKGHHPLHSTMNKAIFRVPRLSKTSKLYSSVGFYGLKTQNTNSFFAFKPKAIPIQKTFFSSSSVFRFSNSSTFLKDIPTQLDKSVLETQNKPLDKKPAPEANISTKTDQSSTTDEKKKLPLKKEGGKTDLSKSDLKKYSFKDSFRIFRSMSKYIWPKNDPATKFTIVSALFLMLAGKGLNVYVPIIFKGIIDSLNVDPSTLGTALSSASIAMIVGYGLARLGATALQELRTAIFSKVQQNSIRRLSLDVYKHLLNMDMKFHLSRETGGLIRAVDRGTKGISYILSAVVVHLTPTLLEIGIVSAILGTQFGSTYVYITLATMVSYIAFTLGITQWRTKFRRQMNNADNKAATIAMDSLLNIESVKYFNAENYQLKKYDQALLNYRKAGLKTSYSLALLNAGQNIIFSISLTTMMYLAVAGVFNGTMSVGDVVMVNGLVFQLSLPLNFLGSVYREMNQAMIDMGTLYNLENTQAVVKDSQDATVIPNEPMKIDFNNVSFSYLQERAIFNNMTFSIEPGKHVAFVGPSGCGKSTILKLLYRFYDVLEGDIKIGGIPIKSIQIESLRKSIAIVPQDTVLFNATIFENIAYGNVEATYEEVIDAAKKADIHSLIMSLPQGYDTPVGERGLMISGGERQRISLARALLKNSSIIMFDEATSALDAQTEQKITASIKKILAQKNCTAIFIAHRLKTIKDVDLIYVVNQGKIVEMGTHAQLLVKGGVYSQLWLIQENVSISS
ncbi:hypothetical protein BB560_000175 [Smittium megazygosporum]|uniref:Iron-sulfur clusters transporter ATM1, mitochondrial n=1 Tax=Smittium megazygosporum TaxID=133381 RepID=A0A2T9ZL46_9FUNG|nr:hypothetical protein BB560_000175 [Smittium megazygosporum]